MRSSGSQRATEPSGASRSLAMLRLTIARANRYVEDHGDADGDDGLRELARINQHDQRQTAATADPPQTYDDADCEKNRAGEGDCARKPI
jgi:hypothetical protein